MLLSEVFKKIRDEIDQDDVIREEILAKTRKTIRACSEAIKLAHRGDYNNSERMIQFAKETIELARDKLQESQFLSHSRVLDTAYQELTEAINLLSILQGKGLVAPNECAIPSRPYLTGLADVVGELRRAILDQLRRNDVQKAEQLLKIMESILDELTAFDYPNALIPDLRRKCDVGRTLVERTRADVTTAIRQERLIKEINGLEGQLTSIEREKE